MGQPEYYKVAEVAARLRVSKMTVYRMIHAGQLPGALPFAGTYRIHATTFDVWLAESQQEEISA